MTSDKADNVADAPRARLLFWAVFAGVVAVSLLAFTYTIGDGRVSGPGICLALSAGTLVWVSRMVFQSARFLVSTGAAAESQEQKAASGRRRKELEREYHTLKRAIKELELDYAMTKVSEEDYQEIRARYRERAVRILRQLDQGQSYRAQIDTDLEARRTAAASTKAPSETSEPAEPHTPTTDKSAEALESAESSQSPAATPDPPTTSAASDEEAAAPIVPGVCAKCETRNDGDAVFCKKCGDKLKAA